MQQGNNVICLAEAARATKRWTEAELAMINRFLEILASRGDAHQPEYFEDDQGHAIVAFTVGWHCDASYSVSKVEGRYVVLRWDGQCIADSPRLASALAKATYGGYSDPEWYFFNAKDILKSAYEKRSTNDGALSA